jgi:hypothetical protein
MEHFFRSWLQLIDKTGKTTEDTGKDALDMSVTTVLFDLDGTLLPVNNSVICKMIVGAGAHDSPLCGCGRCPCGASRRRPLQIRKGDRKMKATGIIRRVDAGVIKTPGIYIAKARGNHLAFCVF